MKPVSKKTSIFFVFAFFLIGTISIVFFSVEDEKQDISNPEIVKQPEIKYSINRHISYSFSIENKSSTVIENARFWTYAPVKQTSTQICRKIESSHEYELVTDDYGNQILCFKFETIPPYGSKIITVSADLAVSENPNLIAANDMGLYLKPAKYIESDNPTIIKTANGFKAGDMFETLKKTFDWVSGNIKYTGYISRDRGALYALKNKKGDCTEYMYLFAALCRANKIPARCIGGYVCRENTVLKPSAYHNWVEIYTGKTWESADPQKKILFDKQSDYIAMRIFGEIKESSFKNFHRFRFQGKGLKVRMNG